MTLYLLAFLIGIIAGLRAMTAPAAVSWAASLGWLPLAGSWASFMGHWVAITIFTVAAIVELITDQLPGTPSRKVPAQFSARIIMGGLCGGAIGATAGMTPGGLVAGVIGAVVGTLGGAEARARLAEVFGKDMPAAIIEDAVAVIGAFVIVSAVM